MRSLSSIAVMGLLSIASLSWVGCRGLHSSSPLPPDPAPTPSDLTADQLLDKSAAARGGWGTLRSVHSVRFSGTMETAQIAKSPVTLTLTPQHYFRRTEIKGGVELIKAVDGEVAWEVTPQAGIVEPTPMIPKEGARFRRLADPLGPLVDAATKGNRVEVVGKMAWAGSTVYKLRVTFPDGGVNSLYLDEKTFLPTRLVNTMFVPQLDKDVEVEVRYSDWQMVEGSAWAMHEAANAPEVGFKQEIVWQKVEINPEVDPSIFALPKR